MECFSPLRQIERFILVGMGPFGFPVRVLGPSRGSFLTYASAENAEAAPGHVTPEIFSRMYRVDSLSRQSRLFGITGNPVMHTKSPAIHNAWLDENGIDGVYLPFESAEPEKLLDRGDILPLEGLSVTVPHKQRIISCAAELDDSVEKTGACNTLVRDEKTGRWTGYNTDWKGFLEPLDSAALKGKSALVIGAGGAAMAVVYALIKSGMMVTVINRTAEKAEKIASRFGCAWMGLEDYLELSCREGTEIPFIAVQTTSAGMSPDVAGNPVPGLDMNGIKIAYDLIYTPEKTAFLKQAEKAGCRIINGSGMLRAQAVEQFRLFTGILPD